MGLLCGEAPCVPACRGVLKRAVDAVAARSPRVSLVMKADIRPGVTDALTSKAATVDRLLAG
jgi:uncharacterized protein YqgV (UPF0045/DUF77 family)